MSQSPLQRVEAKDLTRTYGRSYALRKASFLLEAGTVTAIIGANGAGKSTTFNLLSRRIAPSSGQVLFDGRDLGTETERRRICGYLSHASFLYGALTAKENLSLVAGLYRLNSDDAALDGLLTRVGLARAKNRVVRQFSRGMTQRLALARLLLASPELWLLDEPASGLDDVGRRWLQEEVKGLRDSGRIIAIASHSRQLVGALATHAVVLRKGRVGYAGPVDGAEHIDQLFTESIG